MSAYARTARAKASREQGKKGANSVATSQMPLKALRVSGEFAAEHGRDKLQDTSGPRLELFALRSDPKAVTAELESGFKAAKK
jgi:hypothetical protein